MKKSLAMAAALLISCSAVSMNVLAASAEDTQVYVTIADDKKDTVLVQEPITVTDIDSDGKLTINDALYIAHENKFDGGAAAGYKSSVGQWGLGLDKLWGVENGGSYGYAVNDKMSNGLADEIKNDDQIVAYVYPDPKDYNYFYSFFDKKTDEDKETGSEVTLTLSYISYNEKYEAVTKPVEGAKITVNGKDTGLVTDAEGKVTFTLTEPGKNVISAESTSVNLAPPTYVVNANGEAVTTTTSTTTTTTTTTTTETTTTTTTATSTATTTKTTTKATTTASKSNSPKTGVKGAGMAVFGLAGAIATAFALRRKNEE